MNWIVITVGMTLVLALVAALLGPMFIDWTAYRTTIEANAERLLGTEVALNGEADLRILPSPKIRLTNVRIGPADQPLLTAAAVELDVELTPLLSREFRVREIKLQAPVATVSLAEDGTLDLPVLVIDARFAAFFAMEQVEFGRITVEDGTLRLQDRRTDATLVAQNIALTGNARTLRGPFTADGTARIAGRLSTLRFQGGTLDGGTMPVSARLTQADGGVAVGFEGAVVPRADIPSMRGTITATARTPVPFTLQGSLNADADGIVLTAGTLRYAPRPEASLELNIAASYALGATEPLLVALDARQLDLDRLDLALRPPDAAADANDGAPPTPRPPRPPAAFAATFADFLGPALGALRGGAGFDVPVSVGLDVGAVIVGGALVQDVSAALESSADGILVDRAEALLPGDAALELTGALGPGYRGNVRLSTAQPVGLANWWTGVPLGGAALAPLLLEADVDLSEGLIDAERLNVRIGETAVTGRARYAGGASGPPTLAVSLRAPRLSAQTVIRTAEVLRAARLMPQTLPDVRLDLAADEVLIGGIDGAALSINADLTGGVLTVDAFSAQDLAGVGVFASGGIADLMGDAVGVIDGTLTLADPARLASAITALAPGGDVAELTALLPSLAPADLGFRVSGGAASGDEGLSLTLSGTLGTATVELASVAAVGAEWRDRPARLSLDMRKVDPAVVLAPFGPRLQPSAKESTVRLDFEGTPSTGMEGRATFDGLGVTSAFSGTLALSETLEPRGELTFAAQSLAPLAAALDSPLPGPLPGPVTLSAKVAPAEGGGYSFDALQGAVGEVDVTGALDAARGTLSGALTVSEADFAWLAGLLLGENALEPASDGTRWPQTPFGPPQLQQVALDLAISAARLELGSLTARDARFDLALTPQRLALTDARASLGDGVLTGDFSLTRTGRRADLAASLAIEGLDPTSLWNGGGRALTSGPVDLSATLSATGHTVQSLVSELAGEGTLEAQDVAIDGLNLAAFDLSADAGADAPPEEADVRRRVLAHLDADALTIDDITVPFTLSGGLLRLAEHTIGHGAIAAAQSAALDLNAWTLASNWTLAFPTSAEPVNVDLRYNGPLDAPVRQVDVSALAAWLGLRQLEAQLQAVEAQNQALEAEASAIGTQNPQVGDAAPQDPPNEPFGPPLPTDAAPAAPEDAEPGAPPPPADAPAPADPLPAPVAEPNSAPPARPAPTIPIPAPAPAPPAAERPADRSDARSPSSKRRVAAAGVPALRWSPAYGAATRSVIARERTATLNADASEPA